MYYDMLEKPVSTSKCVEIRWNVGDFLVPHSTKREIANIKSQITNCTVYSEDDLHAVLKAGSPIHVYSAKGYLDPHRIHNAKLEPNVTTPWYLSKEEVDAHLKRVGFQYVNIKHRIGLLYAQHAFPVTFPRRVILIKNEKGPYTRIEMHQELTGKEDADGKPFFPDASSRKNVCAGPAIVHRVFEKPTYGFMKVEMEQFSAPSDAELLRWVQETTYYTRQNIVMDGTISFQHSVFGDHVLVDTSRSSYVVIQGEDGLATTSHILKTYLDWDDPNKINFAKTQAFIRGSDFITQTLYGMSFDEYAAEWGKYSIMPNGYLKTKARVTRWPFQSYAALTNLRDISDGVLHAMVVKTKYNDEIYYVDVNNPRLKYALIDAPDKADFLRMMTELKHINQPAILKMKAGGILKREDTNGMV